VLVYANTKYHSGAETTAIDQSQRNNLLLLAINVEDTSLCNSLAGASISIKGGRERRGRSQKDINLDFVLQIAT
jgi:hypothetical protein